MGHEATELEHYIVNDRKLYERQRLPIYKNLALKAAKGEYSKDRAIDAFMHLVNSGAKQYALEHGSMTDRWDRMFPLSERLEVAESLADYFWSEYKLGNFKDLLPTKYRDAALAAKSSGSSTASPTFAKIEPAKRVEIKRGSGTGYFKPGQFAYALGFDTRGGMLCADSTGEAKKGELCYLVSKTKEMKGGALWFRASSLRFTGGN